MSHRLLSLAWLALALCATTLAVAQEPPAAPAEPMHQPPAATPRPSRQLPIGGRRPAEHRRIVPLMGDAQIARARTITGSLFQQLTHVARSRNITPCQAHAQFQGFKPFAGATDPWGRKIFFQCIDGAMHVTSAGADGQLGTPDDLVNGRPQQARLTVDSAPHHVTPTADAPPSGSKKKRYGALLLVFVGAVVATVVVRDATS